MAKQGKIIGIDLGTTNSVVAVMEGGQPTVILNMEGGRTTPSVVAFLDNGERVVGSPAKNQAVKNPTRTIYSIKRFMGRRHSEVGEEEKIVPYKIVGGAEELVKVDIGGKQYTPPEISAMILQHLKDAAEAHLGEKVTRAVITVPAYFNDSQRQATKDAGRIAGLEVERIINEPTAAALAYGSDKKKAQKVAVYDLGGGTFDISILEIDAGVVEVKSTNGDTHLGGDDFDEVLINHVADEFRKETGINLRADQLALQRLKEECEKVKKELSSTMQATINLPFISMDASGPKHLNQSISRAKFEQLTAKLVDRTRQPCEQALKDARMKPGEVDEILMVGGSTRMPAVQRMVKEIFGKEGNRGVNPDEVVAVGAAIQGGVLGGEVDDVLLLDVTPLSLGIETLGGVFTRLIERNTTIPTQKTQVFSTASDSQPSVEIHVLQGERDMAAGNRTLGKFVLDGIPPSPRGVPQIEVSFDIDANGILNVSAKDRGTSKEQKIRIESSSGLTETEIQRMRKDAEAHASEDRKRRDLIEAKNSADQAIYQADKSLSELGDKVSADDRAEIDGAKKRLEAASKGEDIAALQAALSAFQVAIQKLGEKAYAQGQGGGKPGGGQGSSGGPGAEKGKDDSVDVEYEVKNN